MSVGPIPYESKLAWLDEMEVYSPLERDYTIRILNKLDSIFLSHQQKEAETERFKAKHRH